MITLRENIPQLIANAHKNTQKTQEIDFYSHFPFQKGKLVTTT